MDFKFPKQYKVAAKLLKLASEEDKNVKHLLYNDRKYQHYNIKSLYAIVTKTLEHWDVIEKLIKESNILSEHEKLNIWRIRVIITELIINQKSFPNPENNTIQTVIQYEEQFKQMFSKEQTKTIIRSDAKCKTNVKVRFVKVNLINGSVNSVIQRFQDEGWEKLETAANYQDYLQQLRELEPHSSAFLQDYHIPEVLVFPSGTELQCHELRENGSIFFMNKASCLAPLLLSPHKNSHVLDMCAAPGLKTIQLASYVPSGKVYAVERDAERYNSLQYMLELSGADNVITIHRDVTKLNVDQYKHIEYILVDPSCTGSGIRERQPSVNLKERIDKKTRLEKLSGFQITLLRFALTRFPAAKRVVYSTCSLNVEENENVVQDALNSSYHNFDVVSVEDKLPGWQSFGSSDFQFGHKCVYFRPEVDYTNGFFIAVFERKENQPNISYAISESNEEMSKNQFKEGKRRIHEKSNSDGKDCLMITSHKRFKFGHDQAGENKENGVVAITPHNEGETQTEKINGKKLSLSQKKRSRRKKLKLKIMISSKSNKHGKSKVKVKNFESDELAKKTVKNNSSKTNGDNRIVRCLSETINKKSKAQLRYKRLKLLKSSLASKSNSSNTGNFKNISSNLVIQNDIEGELTTLKKKKKKHSSLEGNLNESPELENALLVKKKEKKRKILLENIIHSNGSEKDVAKKKKSKIKSEKITKTSPSNDVKV